MASTAEAILQLRSEGLGYRRIARVVGLSHEGVRYYIRKVEPRREFLPAGPLQRVVARMVERHGHQELAYRCAERFGEDPARWSQLFVRLPRWRRVRVETADRVCIALGHHPAEVYGEAWWLREEEEAV